MDSNYSHSAGTSQVPVNGKANPTTASDSAKKEKSNSNSRREAGPSTSTNKESKTKRRRDINEQRSQHSHSKHSALDNPSTTYVGHRHRETEYIRKEKKKERKMLDNTNANIPLAESETARLYHYNNDSPFSFHKIQDEEKTDPKQEIKLADSETATKMDENIITTEDIDTYKEEIESKTEVKDKRDIENQEDQKDIKDLEAHLAEDNPKNLKENDTGNTKDKVLEKEEDFWELAKVAYGLKKGAIYEEEDEEDSTQVTANAESDSHPTSRKKAMGGWGITPQIEPEPQIPKPNKKKEKSQKPLDRSFSWLLGPSSDEVVLDSIALFRQMRNLLQNPAGLKKPKKQGP